MNTYRVRFYLESGAEIVTPAIPARAPSDALLTAFQWMARNFPALDRAQLTNRCLEELKYCSH